MAHLDWWPEYGEVDDPELLSEANEAPLSIVDADGELIQVWQ